MLTGTLSVQKLFEQHRRYVVPLYQRPYVWKADEQWEPLWQDIQSVAERLVAGQATRAHFMGAIVLEAVAQPTGHLEKRLVIDGQQRLTTMQVALKAMADVLAILGQDKHAQAARRLTRNDEPLVAEPDGTETYKVWPTNLDQDTFRAVMDAQSLGDVLKLAKIAIEDAEDGEGLLGAHLYFSLRFQQWLRRKEEGFAQRVSALHSAVIDHIRVVVIDLDREDDPQVIFETLNARGTALLPADLIKNALFHRAQRRRENVEQLYRTHWEPFESEEKYWRKLIGKGHAARARIDTFLQHYLTMKLRDEVVVAHLYTTFRDHLGKEPDAPAGSILADIARFGAIYRSFDRMTDGREGLFHRRLASLEVTTLLPVVLDLYAQCQDSPEERTAALIDLESFLVRRMVCQLNTRGYSRLFVELLVAMGPSSGSVASRIRRFLLDKKLDNARWPDDAEFEKRWLANSLYRTAAQRRLRLVLEAIDGALATSKTEQVVVAEDLPIEHLLPRSWRAHWPLPASDDVAKAAEARENLIDTIGNLTLLTTKLNSAVSNGPWAAKRPEILRHSALAMNRRFQDVESWDEDGIRNRGREMFEVARRIWPHPGMPVST